MEQLYITNPFDSAREAWQAAQSAYQHLFFSLAKKKRLFSKQAFFKESEKTSRLLAQISNSHQRSPTIGAIQSQAGPLVCQPEMILQELASFYETLYSPVYTQEDLHLYL